MNYIETLNQVGGMRRLEAMIGAYNFTYNNELETIFFRFKSCKKANNLGITLRSDDTYTMTFYKINPNKNDIDEMVKVVEKYEGIYYDQFIELFEQTTGLILSLLIFDFAFVSLILQLLI